MAKNITKLPPEDRPYEKLEKLGEENLTNSELLAIIIKTGTKDKSCLDISREILLTNLDNINELEYLSNMSITNLTNFKGIGRVKAIQIKAVIELSKRIATVRNITKIKVNSPKIVYDLLNQSYANKKQEIVKTIILDKSNNILSIVTNAVGDTSQINISAKEILSEPIKQLASGIILVHNHPSGNLTPSRADINFTNKMKEYSNIFNIQLLDHIIIGKGEYLSLKEQGNI